MGPNSNDAFASWKRAFTQDFTLVKLHPMTDRFVPWLATHWSVQDDNRTVYFRLDPDARWSDGEPITADDYVFAFTMLQSEHIFDPFWASYIPTYYEAVEKLDEHTLKIVGRFPSWRPLRRFDHILVSDSLRLTDSRVLDYALSDHLPIAVEIELPHSLQLAA